MRAKELAEMPAEELRTKERELREELCRLRLRRGTSTVENPMKFRQTRRDLARVLTVLGAGKGKERSAS